MWLQIGFKSSKEISFALSKKLKSLGIETSCYASVKFEDYELMLKSLKLLNFKVYEESQSSFSDGKILLGLDSEKFIATPEFVSVLPYKCEIYRLQKILSYFGKVIISFERGFFSIEGCHETEDIAKALGCKFSENTILIGCNIQLMLLPQKYNTMIKISIL